MVTGQQVKAAMIANDIHTAAHHDCGACGCTIYYVRDEDKLFFAPGCDCAVAPMEPCSWDDAAAFINAQSTPALRDEIALRFALVAD